MRMSDIIMDYWVQFAKAGDPNGPDRTNWDRYMEFAGDAAMTGVSRLDKYGLLEDYYNRFI